MGTPLYMSPEQVEGRSLDSRTDIYSFGVTCYHMFAGHPPFSGETAIEVAMKHVNTEPEPLAVIRPDLLPQLCGIVHKMMAKRPTIAIKPVPMYSRTCSCCEKAWRTGLTAW